MIVIIKLALTPNNIVTAEPEMQATTAHKAGIAIQDTIW